MELIDPIPPEDYRPWEDDLMTIEDALEFVDFDPAHSMPLYTEPGEFVREYDLEALTK